MSNVCMHGSLARKCEICSRDDDIAFLKRALHCFFDHETDHEYMARAMKDHGIDYEELRKEIRYEPGQSAKARLPEKHRVRG